MLLLCSCVILMIRFAHSQGFPSRFFFPTPETMSVNGSSVTGNCSEFVPGFTGGLSRCDAPASSVLFDGNIPTLTGLDGDMWVGQLLTLETTNEFRREIVSEVTDLVTRVEFVIFNCPEWGISTQTIRLATALSSSGTKSLRQSFNVPTITSCDSLVRICISVFITQPVVYLEFIPPPDSTWTHLAEVTFHGTNSTCPQATIIPSQPLSDATTDGTSIAMNFATPTTSNTSLLTPSTTSMPDSTTVSTQCEACPSCSTSTALASVITAIATALLATVISVLVMFVVCKCHPKFTPGGGETGTSARGEGQEYEEVDGGRGGVAVSDPTYMEVDGGGGRGGGNTFQLKENEAYASTLHK